MKVFVAFSKFAVAIMCVVILLVGATEEHREKPDEQRQNVTGSAFPEIVSEDTVAEINAKLTSGSKVLLAHNFVGDLKIVYSSQSPRDGRMHYLAVSISDPLASNPDEIKKTFLSDTMGNLFRALFISERSFYFSVQEMYHVPVVFFRTSKAELASYVASFLLTPKILINGIQHAGPFSMRPSSSGYYVIVLKGQLLLAPASPPYDLVVLSFMESFKDAHSDDFVSKKIYLLTEEGLAVVPSSRLSSPRGSI